MRMIDASPLLPTSETARFTPLEQYLCDGRAPNVIIAIRDSERFCYSDFSKNVRAWYAAFAQQSGKNWAIYFDDSFEFACALFGAWAAGKCVWLCADRQSDTLQSLQPHVDGFVGTLPAEYTPLLCAPTLQNLLNPVEFSAFQSQAEALVVYTSGSSGTPSAIHKKFCQLSTELSHLHSCWPDLFNSQHALHFCDQARVIHATVSHQHIYGLLFRVLWPLLSGRIFSATRLVYPEDILSALHANPGVLISSPAHLKRLPKQLNWSAVKIRLFALYSSGDALPEAAAVLCRSLFDQAPIEVYGSSETGGIAWRQTSLGSTWSTLPGVEVRVLDQQLQVRSAHLPNLDWHDTQDCAELSPSGTTSDGFILKGRLDRIVKLEEKRISLSAMEKTLMATGLLDDVKALLLTDNSGATRMQIAVLAMPNAAGWAIFDGSGKRALNTVLRAALSHAFELSALPRKWRYHWAMPQNSQGKTAASALQALFDSRRPQARLLSANFNEGVKLAALQITVAANSPYFEGHFPGTPILAGMVQIDWAILFGRELFELPPCFLRIEAVKFTRILTPGVARLELKFAPERGCLSFQLSSTTGIHASARIFFGADQMQATL
jgi:acyl-coenzyme A synthetase/AMP-(fatty) acid ligase